MKKVFIPTLALLITFASISPCYAWVEKHSAFPQVTVFTEQASSRNNCYSTIEDIISPQINQIMARQDDGRPIGRAHVLLNMKEYLPLHGTCKIHIQAISHEEDAIDRINSRVREYMLEEAPNPN